MAFCIVAMLFVRAYVFTVFTVTAPDLHPTWQQGSRVLVNRLSRNYLKRGEYVVFGDTTYYIGCITALPGDTLTYRNSRYIIPRRCCNNCDCDACQYYMVTTGKSHLLVRHGKIIGRARHIFPFNQ